MIDTRSILDFSKGTIEQILSESYKELHAIYPEYLSENLISFHECDSFFYDNPQIGNRCSFISVYENEPIGMCCWDPRQKPIVILGHNCIIPKCRGKRLGCEQLKLALAKLKSNGFNTAQVSTGLLSFFVPAQRMYTSVGFVEIKRDTISDNVIKLHDQVYYEMEI